MISPETRMMGLPRGEEIMIVGRTMWTQSTSVTDRQTDGRTDGRTDRITITKTVQRRASHGKNRRKKHACAVNQVRRLFLRQETAERQCSGHKLREKEVPSSVVLEVIAFCINARYHAVA